MDKPFVDVGDPAWQQAVKLASEGPLFTYMCRVDFTDGLCRLTLYDRVGETFGAPILHLQGKAVVNSTGSLRGQVYCTAPPHAWAGLEVDFRLSPSGNYSAALVIKPAAPAASVMSFGQLGGEGLGQQTVQDRARFSDAAPFLICTLPESQVVNLNAGSFANGAVLNIWEREYADAQHWHLRESAPQSGEFLIINVLSGKAITVENMSSQAGAALVQWEVNSKSNQLWTIEHARLDVTDSRVVFASAFNPELVMDLRGAQTDNGTAIVQWPRNSQFNQSWLIHTIRP